MKLLPDRPRIAVVGAGAVGGYYGAKLARHGEDVHFLLRSDFEHVRERGFVVKSPRGDFELPNVPCASATEEIGPCDLVLIALKATANRQLEELIPPLLGESTVLLTLQNGLGNEEFLATRFGPGRVMGGLCFTCINKTAPGRIEHLGQGQISVGEYEGAALKRTLQIRDLFRASDIECEAKDDLERERWIKLVWNIPFNGLSIAEGGVDVGELLSDSARLAKVKTLMQETIAGAAAHGHELPEGLVEKKVEVTRSMDNYKPSSLIDYLEGKEVEVEAIWGEPLRRAKGKGAEMPALEDLYARLKTLCESALR